jgi:endonuclease-3 related protein
MAFSRKIKLITPLNVYKALLKHYGPQGWWPVTKPGGLVPGYHNSKKLKTRVEVFEIAIGALLTQNTSWNNVEKAIGNLNRAGMLSCEKIHAAGLEALAVLIKPSGYYNQKAVRLKTFASYLVENYSADINKLFSKQAEKLREELLSIKGIGPETADSMILYGASKPLFVADNYTIRFGRRLGWFGENSGYGAVARYFMERLPESAEIYAELHALIVALGKEHCRKKMFCAGCILKKDCSYGRQN